MTDFKQAGKCPRDFHAAAASPKTIRKNCKKKLEFGNVEDLEKFMKIDSVLDFVTAEKKKRKDLYYQVRYIIAIAPLGTSYFDMTYGYGTSSFENFELDKVLMFKESKSRQEPKFHKKIEKRNKESFSEGYLLDKFQALVCWEDEEYSNTPLIVPLSFCDKRSSIIYMLDCPIITDCSLEEVLINAMTHYNRYYNPAITQGDLNNINSLYKSNVGKMDCDEFILFEQKFLKAYLYNGSTNYLLFNNGIHYKIIEEKEALSHPEVDFSWAKVRDRKLDSIKSPYKNKDLMIRAYKRSNKRMKLRMSRNMKKMIKETSWQNSYCIKHTFANKKVYFKNNVAKKLSIIDFKNEFKTMTSFNKIIGKFNRRLVFSQCCHQKISTKSHFAADILIIKNPNTYSSFHMIPLRKGKIEVETFDTPYFKSRGEEDVFLVYEYNLEKIENEIEKVYKKGGQKRKFLLK